MTPEQRMEVVRWMLDSIDRIVEKSEPPAIATINRFGPDLRNALSPDGEREETKPCSCHTSMKCLVAANDLAPGFHCILDAPETSETRLRLSMMNAIAAREHQIAKLTAELAEVRRQRDEYVQRVRETIEETGECFPKCTCDCCQVVRRLMASFSAALPASQAGEVHGE